MVDRFKLFSFEDESTTDIIAAMFEYIEELRDVLDDLDFGDLFNTSEYTRETFSDLLKSFVEGQRGKFSNINVPGSWGLIEDDKYGLPSEAKVDFVYTPTYIITSILSRTFLDYPEIAETIPGYLEALKKGLNFCPRRGLSGHGYDCFKGQAEALEVLGLGHVPELLEKNPEWSPSLLKCIQDITEQMQRSLEKGNAVGFWGESLEDAFRGAVASILLTKDEELMNRIKEYEGGLLK